ncbi:MAG: subunit of tubulin prefoldin [Caeruleum heppii]|nr:MAG: subunit of tubulin prefoldin [Caeruleum heppii]
MSTPTAPPNGAQTIDLSTLPLPQLRQLKQQLDAELEHLTQSFAKLRGAQARFRDCVGAIEKGVIGEGAGGGAEAAPREILVPLTTSLYVPGRLADRENVLVDVGTGFFVEKSTKDAIAFYNARVEELGTNLKDLEAIVQGKSRNVRMIEDALRQKVMEGGAAGESAAVAS